MKQTLPQTSPLTPAIVGESELFLAWTGDDNQLHVVRAIDAGPVNQWDLGEYSFSGPALAVFNDRLYIAWTGTDQYRLLNVMSAAYGDLFTTDPHGPFVNKQTILEDSLFGPALAAFKGELYIGWTGVDQFQLLNVMPSADGYYFDRSRKTIVREDSIATPALATVDDADILGPDHSKLYLSWTGTDSPNHLNLISSEDGQVFRDKIILNSAAFEGQGLPARDLTSAAGPSLLTNYLTGGGPGADPWLFLAWTGFDGHLYSTYFQRPNSGVDLNVTVARYADTSDAGPTLGQIAVDDLSPRVAWIGTGNHQLNQARLDELPP